MTILIPIVFNFIFFTEVLFFGVNNHTRFIGGLGLLFNLPLLWAL